MHPNLPTIETGVYRHYEGELYFVSGVREDPETSELWVGYDELHENSRVGGYCKKLSDFFAVVRKSNNNPLKFHEATESRFILIKALPSEKMQILLPGTLVEPSWDRTKEQRLRVKRLFERGGEVFVQLERITQPQEQGPDDQHPYPIKVSSFLNGDFVIFKDKY